MSANTAIRVARTQRMLAELGHSDIFDALRHAEEMRSALRVIYTWAGVDGEELDHRQVRKLAGKALHMGANAEVTGPLQREDDMSNENTPGAADDRPAVGGPVQREVRPLVEPAAWIQHHKAGDNLLWDDPGGRRTGLYALTPEDVEAVNKARKETAWKAARRLDLCKCDHNEYCRHCYPAEFRPGGVWGRPNAELSGAELAKRPTQTPG